MGLWSHDPLSSHKKLPITLTCACLHVKSLQLCLILCAPMAFSPPDSSVHGILHTRILEWVAMSSSRGLSLTQGSNAQLSCLLHLQSDSLPLTPPGKPRKLQITKEARESIVRRSLPKPGNN